MRRPPAKCRAFSQETRDQDSLGVRVKNLDLFSH